MDAIALGATLSSPPAAPISPQSSAAADPDLRSAVLCLEEFDPPSGGPARAHQSRRAAAGRAGARRPGPVRPAARLGDAHAYLELRGRREPRRLRYPQGDAGAIGLAPLPCRRPPPVDADPRTPQLLDESELRSLRDQFLAVQPRILAIRIGGNDLFKAIGARRSAVRTAYDGPLGTMIAGFVSAFAPFGFALSAPVFEHFANADLLREEVERDLEHRPLTKTRIHPRKSLSSRPLMQSTPTRSPRRTAMVMGEPAALSQPRRDVPSPRPMAIGPTPDPPRPGVRRHRPARGSAGCAPRRRARRRRFRVDEADILGEGIEIAARELARISSSRPWILSSRSFSRKLAERPVSRKISARCSGGYRHSCGSRAGRCLLLSRSVFKAPRTGAFPRPLVQLAEHLADLLDLGQRRIGQAVVAGRIVGGGRRRFRGRQRRLLVRRSPEEEGFEAFPRRLGSPWRAFRWKRCGRKAQPRRCA